MRRRYVLCAVQKSVPMPQRSILGKMCAMGGRWKLNRRVLLSAYSLALFHVQGVVTGVYFVILYIIEMLLNQSFKVKHKLNLQYQIHNIQKTCWR